MPLPSARDLAYAVQAARVTPLPAEPYYRSVDLHVVANLGIKVLDGTRSGVTGKRYNGPGSAPTCYLAGTQTLAAFECEQEAFILRLHRLPRNPRVTFAATIVGAMMLDLTTQLVLQGFGLTPTDLLVPSQNWQYENQQGRLADTQVLGDACRIRSDIDGLIVPSWLSIMLPPSVLPRSENLVLFMDPSSADRPRRSSVKVQIHDPTGLLP